MYALSIAADMLRCEVDDLEQTLVKRLERVETLLDQVGCSLGSRQIVALCIAQWEAE